MIPGQVLIVAAFGGAAGVLSLLLVVLLALGLFAAVSRLAEAYGARRDRRQALKDGRRRLDNFTTIDDLKD